MTVIRYTDIYRTFVGEDGELYQELVEQDVGIPVIITNHYISSIEPYMGQNGRPFKNVSIINYNGEKMKVVGNYRQLEALKNNSTKFTGFKK